MTMEFTRTVIVFPMTGKLECTVGHKTIRAARGDAVMFGPIRRKTTVHPDETGTYRSLSIISPAAEDGRSDGRRTNSGLAAGEWKLRRDPEALGPIMAFLDYMFTDLASASSVLASNRVLAAAEILIGGYFDQLLQGQVGGAANGAALSRKQVSTARAYMVAHYADPISVSDIAKACDVSVRNLQATFKSVVGLSPRQVLTAIRLERARHALERATGGASVADAALGAGFCHLGRFSKTYRATYGELPSETLRKSR